MIIEFIKKNKVISGIVGIIITTYLISMVVFPVVESSMDWAYVQKVWISWQTLNAAMIAFIATALAIATSIIYEKEQKESERERNYMAYLALLPQVLVDLSEYLSASMKVYIEALERTRNGPSVHTEPLKTPIPPYPTDHLQVFRECIFNAEPQVGKRLAQVLTHLQVHNSRMKVLAVEIGPESTMILASGSIHNEIYFLSEIHAWLNRLLTYSRGDHFKIDSEKNEFNDSVLEWEDFRSAFYNYSFLIDNNTELKEYIDCKIESKKMSKP